jgi:hypothetical protein
MKNKLKNTESQINNSCAKGSSRELWKALLAIVLPGKASLRDECLNSG